MSSQEAPPHSAPATPVAGSPSKAAETSELELASSMKKPAASTPKKRPQPKAATPKKTPKKAQKAMKKADRLKSSPKAKAKSKTLAKRKALAKSKVVAKSKACKGVSKAEQVLKKPASSMPLKRPAAAPAVQAGKSAKTSSMQWASKLQVEEHTTEKDFEEHGEEEQDPGADDMEVDPSEANFQVDDGHRDRSKNTKFKKMLSDGQLPKWAVDAWHATEKLTTGRPAAQRELVNNIISREDGSGKLSLNLTNPVLDEMKSTYQKNESKDSHKALTKTLFCGKFNLNEDQFQAGLAAGEYHEVIGKDGKVRYSWQVQEHSVLKGQASSVTLHSENHLSKKDAAFEAARMSNPFIGLFAKNTGQLAVAGSATPLALCDKETELSPELWQQAQTQLTAAIKFWDNHIKDAKKLLQQVGLNNEDNLYNELLLICYSCLTVLCILTRFLIITTLEV